VITVLKSLSTSSGLRKPKFRSPKVLIGVDDYELFSRLLEAIDQYNPSSTEAVGCMPCWHTCSSAGTWSAGGGWSWPGVAAAATIMIARNDCRDPGLRFITEGYGFVPQLRR